MSKIFVGVDVSEVLLFSDDLPILKSRNGKRKVQDFETIAAFRK